jgi:NTE family protein
MDRLNEITFNSALIGEMRAIDFVKRLLLEGKLDPAHYKDVLMHRIDGGEVLEQMGATTKVSTEANLIRSLHELGQTHARRWLS